VPVLTTSGSTFARARAGDGEALDALLREHREAVAAVCHRRLRSRVDADDALQETMVRAMGALGAVRDETRVRAYLCRIAERVCLDMMRAGARPMPELVDDGAPSEEPEAVVIRREEAELVRRTLQALTARQAEALWMRDAMGEPVPAVAEHLGMTEGSTRVLLTRARRSMRDGWAKVAAAVPGFGVKLPAPLAKLLTGAGFGPVVVAPAAVLVAAALLLPLGGTDAGTEPADRAPAEAPPALPAAAAATAVAPATAVDPAPAPAAPVGAVPRGETARSAGGPAAVAAPPARAQDPAVAVDTPVGRTGVTREDRAEDDVTAGDGDVVEVGAGVEDVVPVLQEAPAPEAGLPADLLGP
jgi:RNA polymerase sigma factor (sigma-70 family)